MKARDALVDKGAEDGPLPESDNCLLSVKLGAETRCLGYRGLDAQ